MNRQELITLSEKAKQKDDAPQNASETPAESTALAAA